MGLGRVDYERRRETRIERLRERAERLQREGNLSISSARRIAAIIPFGQPVLVGHHSEKRHRRDLDRIDGGFARGFKALNAAERLEARADAAEKNRSISSDDPSAIDKLREKKAKLEKERDGMKAVNAIIRKAKGDKDKAVEALVASGLMHEMSARKAVEPDFAGRVGFPSYHLTNIGGEIRRVEARIAQLEREAVRPDEVPEEEIGNVIVRERDNRVQLVFRGKPSAECRADLKSRGFRWAPSEGAWQRLANDNARRVARDLAKCWENEG